MYRAGRKPEAQRLARDLGIKLVGPLEGLSPRALLGAQVALVLGQLARIPFGHGRRLAVNGDPSLRCWP